MAKTVFKGMSMRKHKVLITIRPSEEDLQATTSADSSASTNSQKCPLCDEHEFGATRALRAHMAVKHAQYTRVADHEYAVRHSHDAELRLALPPNALAMFEYTFMCPVVACAFAQNGCASRKLLRQHYMRTHALPRECLKVKSFALRRDCDYHQRRAHSVQQKIVKAPTIARRTRTDKQLAADGGIATSRAAIVFVPVILNPAVIRPAVSQSATQQLNSSSYPRRIACRPTTASTSTQLDEHEFDTSPVCPLHTTPAVGMMRLQRIPPIENVAIGIQTSRMNVYDELDVDYDTTHMIPHSTNGGGVMMYESVATGTHDDDFNTMTAMGYMGYSPVVRTSTFASIQQQHAATMVDFSYETIGTDDTAGTTAIYNVAHTQTEHADQVIQSYLMRRQCQDCSSMTST